MSDDNFAQGVGQGQASPEPVDAYDKKAGKYKDPVQQVATEQRLPTTSLPKAPDPSPFVLGPMSPGGR